MINILAIYITISICYCSSLVSMNGDIQKFSMMNTGSFINSDIVYSNGISRSFYNVSFIQFPADIRMHHLLFQTHISSTLIGSANIDLLDYGTLENENEKFSANDTRLEVSLFSVPSNSFVYGASIGYIYSSISSFSKSEITYDFGIKKFLFNKHLVFGLSIENGIKQITSYSNISDFYQSQRIINFEYNFDYLNTLISLDFLQGNTETIDYRFAVKKSVSKNIDIFLGKYIYNGDHIDYKFFDRTSVGIGVQIHQYLINFGIQSLSDGIMNFGSSVTIIK